MIIPETRYFQKDEACVEHFKLGPYLYTYIKLLVAAYRTCWHDAASQESLHSAPQAADAVQEVIGFETVRPCKCAFLTCICIL